mgnify:CR=1 FL=1
MMAANIAPGMNRSFTAEDWTNLIPRKLWYDSVNEANDMIEDDIDVDIQGYDADGAVVRIARQNAQEAGVGHLIHFQEREVKDLSHPKKYGFIITNRHMASVWKIRKICRDSISHSGRVSKDWIPGRLI